MKAVIGLKVLWVITLVTAFLGTLLSFSAIPNLFAYRILLVTHLVLFIIALTRKGQEMKYDFHVNEYFIFLALWFSWALVSFFWAPGKLHAFKNIGFLFSGLSLIFFNVYYFRQEKGMRLLWQAILLVLIFLILLGLWELVTGLHIYGGFPYYYLKNHNMYLMGTFGHPNNFATYLSMYLPLLYTYSKYVKNPVIKIGSVFFLLLGVHLIINSTSRANMLAISIGFIVALIFYFSNGWGKLLRGVIIGTAGVVLLAFCLSVIPAFSGFWEKEKTEFITNVGSVYHHWSDDGSINVRKKLIVFGLNLVKESHGLGVGAGNTSYLMQHNIEKTGGNVKLHNWWVEVLVDYGVVIWMVYLIFFLKLSWDLLSIFRTSSSKLMRMLAEGVLISLITFSVGVVSNGSMVSSRHMWILYGVALCVINNFRYGAKLAPERRSIIK
ncbi:MAG: O-antigen ligase family protein [Bacillota bacterium]|jgi:teichuronic acid biosynthesis protein TuaE